MLKKRIIPVLLLRGGRMVKGKQFTDFRDTGNPKTAVRIYSSQEADELVLLDIQGSDHPDESLIEVLKIAAEECFMPLTAGGGIRTIEAVRELILAGADKVVINTAAVLDPSLITRTAEQFGRQCVVAGIDHRREGDRDTVWINRGTTRTELSPLEHAQHLVELGAGEILLNSIDRDGMMEGYDLALADSIAQAVSVPVIVCGGAGNFVHLADALGKTAVSAAACGSLFHFGDNNPIRARSYMRNLDIPMRRLK